MSEIDLDDLRLAVMASLKYGFAVGYQAAVEAGRPSMEHFFAARDAFMAAHEPLVKDRGDE